MTRQITASLVPADQQIAMPSRRRRLDRLRLGVACFASDGGRSGIGQYLVNVVHRLPQLAPDDEFVVFAPERDAHLWRALAPNARLDLVSDRYDSPVPSLLWHSAVLPRRLRAQACNAVFLPAGNRRLGLAYGVPSVATVHDLSQLHVPQKYDAARMFYATKVLPALIGRQDRIVTVSSSTRMDLLDRTGVSAERIDVVPNGVDLSRYAVRTPDQVQPMLQRLGIDRPYLLYVARLEHPGKNHVTLLQAYARLRDQGIAHKLVLAGPRWDGAEAIDAEIARLDLADHVIFSGFVANADLPDLYAGAAAFVFPSLYEGFGIPLLEAMACGIPACVANVSSLPEVAGDAALLFDPRDPVAMADAMHRLLTDDVLRSRLRRRGLERCVEFTWERSAQGVLDACRAVTPVQR